jgi:hypothetical protein
MRCWRCGISPRQALIGNYQWLIRNNLAGTPSQRVVRSPGSNPKVNPGNAIPILIGKAAQSQIRAATSRAVARLSPASNHKADRAISQMIRSGPAKRAVKAARPRTVGRASSLASASCDAGVVALRRRFLHIIEYELWIKTIVHRPGAFDPPAEAEWHRMIAEAEAEQAQTPTGKVSTPIWPGMFRVGHPRAHRDERQASGQGDRP